MKKGINCIGDAQLCPACALAMRETHVVRCMGGLRKAGCERCGKETRIMRHLYTMKGREKERRGLLKAPPS